jgi:hypothetical protein
VSIGTSSKSLFERGILTILAVGKAVSVELTGAVAVTTFGFIWEVLTFTNIGL